MAKAKKKAGKAKSRSKAKPKAPQAEPRALDAYVEDWYSDKPESPEAEVRRRKRDTARAVRTSRVRQAREDPNAFAEYAFEDSVSGNRLRQAEVHRDLQGAIRDQDISHLMVEFPRNHGKTTQVEIAILWLLGNEPNLRFKIVCESDNKAQERVQHLAQHIMGNSRIRDVFPNLKPARRGDWTKKKIVVDRSRLMRDVSIEACGIQTAATGGRADYLVADDPVGRRNALEIPKLRETVKRAWHSDWLNLLEPSGRTIYIYTPWHTADLSHQLKKNPVYRVFSRPVGPNMEPVWEEKWPPEKLRAKLLEVGQREFDRGYRLIALSGEFATVQTDWIKYWADEPNLADLVVFTAYDLSTGEGEDYFASVTVALDGRDIGQAQPRIYVLDAWHNHLTFMGQIGAVISEARTWYPKAVALEAVQYQAVLPQVIQAARADKSMRLTAEVIPINPRLSKALRLSAVTPLLELGRVQFNPALDPGRGLRGDLVEELTLFPLASHDDLVDAFVYATALAVDWSIRAGTGGIRVSTYGDEVRGVRQYETPGGGRQRVEVGGSGIVEGSEVPPLHQWAHVDD